MLQEGFDVKFKSKRFQIKECPYVISTGNFYVVVDTFKEMMDISFDSDWSEAEEFCLFMNELYYSPRNHIKNLINKQSHIYETDVKLLLELEELIYEKND